MNENPNILSTKEKQLNDLNLLEQEPNRLKLDGEKIAAQLSDDKLKKLYETDTRTKEKHFYMVILKLKKIILRTSKS